MGSLAETELISPTNFRIVPWRLKMRRMIREWTLERFKSVASRQRLPLRGLTVFAGANSSGKSTILQSMLLLAQTLRSRVEQRQLLLNGELVRLGTFEDILSKTAGTEPGPIRIEFELQAHPKLLSQPRRLTRTSLSWGWFYQSHHANIVSGELEFGKVKGAGGDAIEDRHAELLSATFLVRPAGAVDVSTPDKDDKTEAPQGRFSLTLRNESEVDDLMATSSHRDLDETTVRSALKHAISGDHRDLPLGGLRSRYGFDQGHEFQGVTLEHFLPQFLISKQRAAAKRFEWACSILDSEAEPQKRLSEWNSENDLVLRAIAQVLLNEMDGELNVKDPNVNRRANRPWRTLANWNTILEKVIQKIGDTEQAKATEFTLLAPTPLISIASTTIAAEFEGLRYLGPLRDEPRPLYGIGSGSDPTDVGNKGEYTAAVLDLYGTKKVDFVAPTAPHGEISQSPLRSAVHAWLQHFDMATRCETEDAGKLGHKLYIVPDGLNSQLDLTNVGVGLSQVLPILVMALISEPGAVLLFEQPELHLHPRVQSLLADFFLTVLRTKRQCIVETHSEYLVNRLRRRVAESPWGSHLGDDVLLYFVERKKAQSYFTPIDINPFGAIPDWPSGFFDQGPTESESIMAAADHKRKTRPSK